MFHYFSARRSFIVYDVCSFPQIPQTTQTRVNGERTDQEKASRSISAYVERSSHFFVLCPSVQNEDKKDLSTIMEAGSRVVPAAWSFLRSFSRGITPSQPL